MSLLSRGAGKYGSVVVPSMVCDQLLVSNACLIMDLDIPIGLVSVNTIKLIRNT